MIRLLPALVAIAALPATAASAQDRAEGSVVVSYADLDLSGRPGAAALQRRLVSAADRVCGASMRNLQLERARVACKRAALEDARHQLVKAKARLGGAPDVPHSGV